MSHTHPDTSTHNGAHNVVIGLGANLENRRETLQKTWLDIQSHPCLFPVALSSPYCSQPVDMASPHWFINAVGLIQTSLRPHLLLRLLHDIEQRYGRRRTSVRNGHDDRILDLDLLLYDDAVICDEELTVPHPRMTDRLFVMVPLVEVAAGFVHPQHGKTMQMLLDDLRRRKPQQEIRPHCWQTGVFERSL